MAPDAYQIDFGSLPGDGWVVDRVLCGPRGFVDFSICPHVNGDDKPGNTMAEAESWAAGIDGPAYAVDDDTAFKVVDGTVEVISEGHWRLFTSERQEA